MFGGGFGGFPFGSHRQEEEEQYEQDSKLYEVMGLDKNANDDQIRKSYKKLAIKLHPDKQGGSQEKFKELQMAYSILKDKEKREVYDKYGLKGVKEMDQGGHPGGGMDIFDHFFGGGMGGGRAQKRGPQKAKPRAMEIQVKLEDVYNGKSEKVNITRKRNCETCEGKGGSKVNTCSPCKGRGVVEKVMMLGPGMYQHVQQKCGDCKGEGKSIDPSDICKTCKGRKVFEQNKTLDVYVEPGTPDKHVIEFYGEGDEYPGISAGDIQVVVTVQKHKTFQRKGADIYTNVKINLLEALTGFIVELTHVGGKKLGIENKQGEIITDGMIKVIKKKGLPFFKDTISTGNLYIKFEIEYPKSKDLTPEKCEALKQLLPVRKQNAVKASQTCNLEAFDESELNDNVEGGRKREEEDDEEGQHGGQRVQCQQQ